MILQVSVLFRLVQCKIVRIGDADLSLYAVCMCVLGLHREYIARACGERWNAEESDRVSNRISK